MGIDAESTDLTARIRARRKAGVAAGDVEPALPGEHALHGRGGVDIERLTAAHEARDRRAARAGGEVVVDFEYLEGEQEALGLSPEDGGEEVREDHVEDAEAIAEFAALPDEVDEPIFDLSTEGTPQEPDATQYDAVQYEILVKVEELHDRLDGQDAALLLLAQAIMELPDTIAAVLAADERWRNLVAASDAYLAESEREPSWIARAWRWLRTPR